jgi:hypothetical protein
MRKAQQNPSPTCRTLCQDFHARLRSRRSVVLAYAIPAAPIELTVLSNSVRRRRAHYRPDSLPILLDNGHLSFWTHRRTIGQSWVHCQQYWTDHRCSFPERDLGQIIAAAPSTTGSQKEQFDVELFCGITPLRARPTRETLCGIYRGPGDRRGARRPASAFEELLQRVTATR